MLLCICFLILLNLENDLVLVQNIHGLSINRRYATNNRYIIKSYNIKFICAQCCSTHNDYMSNMAGVLQKAGAACPSRSHDFSPVFDGIRVVLFSFLYCALLVFVLCLAYPMLPASLDCPFLIALSVFSNVFFLHLKEYILNNLILYYSVWEFSLTLCQQHKSNSNYHQVPDKPSNDI